MREELNSVFVFLGKNMHVSEGKVCLCVVFKGSVVDVRLTLCWHMGFECRL